jgi:GNAT superfamily N-acetyltransferase
MTLSIRPVSPADETVWSELYAGYREFYREQEDPAKVQAAWRMLFDPATRLEGLVAVREGRVVGLANWREFPDQLSASTGIFLDDLYVSPDARGHGAAQQLLGALAQVARDRGIGVVRWITAPDNIAARRLYDRVAELAPWVTYDLTP